MSNNPSITKHDRRKLENRIRTGSKILYGRVAESFDKDWQELLEKIYQGMKEEDRLYDKANRI